MVKKVKSDINIMDEVTRALADYFPEINIYNNNQEAGFKRPAFAVYIPNLYSNRQLAGHTMRNYLVIIKYFPPKDIPAGSNVGRMERSSNVDMMEQWEAFMETKPFGFLVWNRRNTITDSDDTLNIKFNAKFRVVSVPDEEDKDWELMQSLKQEVYVRNGRRY